MSRVATSARYRAWGKVSVSTDRYRAMGLFVEHDTLWRCGDYCLYALLEDIPDARRIWMIEPDVYVNGDVAALVKRIDGASAALDLVVTRFSKANPAAPWQETMVPFSQDVYICQFPLLTITPRAVRQLHRTRLAMAAHFARQIERDGKITGDYPNDEAFTATTCMNHGFACADFNALGPTIHTANTFSFVIPKSRKYLTLARPDQLVYHPVATGDGFRAKADFFLGFSRDRVAPQERRAFMEPVLATIAHEAGDRSRLRLRARLLGESARSIGRGLTVALGPGRQRADDGCRRGIQILPAQVKIRPRRVLARRQHIGHAFDRQVRGRRHVRPEGRVMPHTQGPTVGTVVVEHRPV